MSLIHRPQPLFQPIPQSILWVHCQRGRPAPWGNHPPRNAPSEPKAATFVRCLICPDLPWGASAGERRGVLDPLLALSQQKQIPPLQQRLPHCVGQGNDRRRHTGFQFLGPSGRHLSIPNIAVGIAKAMLNTPRALCQHWRSACNRRGVSRLHPGWRACCVLET